MSLCVKVGPHSFFPATMSQDPIALVVSSLSSLCGREILVLAFPEHEFLIRSFSGLIIGAGVFHFSRRTKDVALWGFGVSAVMDLLLTETLAWTVVPAIGWLIASAGLEASTSRRESLDGRGKPKGKVNGPVGTVATIASTNKEVTRSGPGTLHTRFVELPKFTKPPSNESDESTTVVLPLTSANIQRLIDTTMEPLAEESTDDEGTVYTEFQTARTVSSRTYLSMGSTKSTSTGEIPLGDRHVWSEICQVQPTEPETSDDVDLFVDPSPLSEGLLTPRLIAPPLASPILIRVEIAEPEGDAIGTSELGEEADTVRDDLVTQEDNVGLMIDLFTETSSFSTVSSTELGVTPQELRCRAEAFRQQAISARNRRDALDMRRKEAVRLKRGGEGLELKFASKEAEREADRADRRAAKLFFKERNRKPTFFMDVHYLKKNEALRVIEKALRDVQLQGGRELKVMVGKGKHSPGGISILKPFVKNRLRQQGIQVQEASWNPGMLIITLT
ncbi:hypothetical protein K439DRAFT_1662966 [Ramaria rubella]|nr:hypothetical protein K439DRAFT_1662966 [Ramaria rubella]